MPIDGDIDAANRNRQAWIEAGPARREQMARPETEPIAADEFQGGTIAFVFARTHDYQHWEVRSMYPAPREGNVHQP